MKKYNLYVYYRRYIDRIFQDCGSIPGSGDCFSGRLA